MNVASLELCKELYELSGWKTETMSMGLHQNAPAYDLGYLLRKLPSDCPLASDGETWSIAYIDEDGANREYSNAMTPEDATCLLAIELFKSGVLTKEAKP